MVGAIGFEPTQHQSFQILAGLGWQPKDRNGSHWNNYWTRIGHGLRLRLNNCFENYDPRWVLTRSDKSTRNSGGLCNAEARAARRNSTEQLQKIRTQKRYPFPNRTSTLN